MKIFMGYASVLLLQIIIIEKFRLNRKTKKFEQSLRNIFVSNSFSLIFLTSN